MKVRERGEFPLIQDIIGLLREAGGSPALAGPGDDAAAWRSSYPVTLATTDSLVQGIHFTSATLSWRDLGWKALATGLSDIAAMGGEPQQALVALHLPPQTQVESVLDFYRGLLDLARRFGVTVAGGNISRSPQIAITLTVLGGLEGEEMLRRSQARPGDALAVTGYLGASAAGLKWLQGGRKRGQGQSLVQAHLRPWPRVAEGRALLQMGIRAAIDISDGLVSDLTQVCLASGAAARVHLGQVPVHPQVKAAFPRSWRRLALAGGEDYELLFAGPPGKVDEARQALKTPVTVIGQVEVGEPGKVALVAEDGREVAAPARGWDHFR